MVSPANSNHADDFVDICSSLAPEIGDATGTVYGLAAAGVLSVEAAPTLVANPGVGTGSEWVRDTMDNFVTEHWPDSCLLMDHVGSAVAQGAESAWDTTSDYAHQAGSYLAETFSGDEVGGTASSFDDGGGDPAGADSGGGSDGAVAD